MKPALVFLMLACLAGCVPWTVRPLGEGAAGTKAERFDAARFADAVWEAKLLPAIDAAAVDLKQALADGAVKPGAHAAVRGRARVLKVNAAPRSGSLLLDLLPGDGRADAALQIGPEIRGTSLRDATPAVQFSQFVNQIDFANAGSELNRRAARGLPPAAELHRAAGRSIEFTGTFTAAPGEPPEIVPVRFRWIEERK